MDPEEVYYMRAPGRLGGLEGVEYYITYGVEGNVMEAEP
jgi:hypothetical protein